MKKVAKNLLNNFCYHALYYFRFLLFRLPSILRNSLSSLISTSLFDIFPLLGRVSYFGIIFFCFPLSLLRFLFCSDNLDSSFLFHPYFFLIVKKRSTERRVGKVCLIKMM